MIDEHRCFEDCELLEEDSMCSIGYENYLEDIEKIVGKMMEIVVDLQDQDKFA